MCCLVVFVVQFDWFCKSASQSVSLSKESLTGLVVVQKSVLSILTHVLIEPLYRKLSLVS